MQSNNKTDLRDRIEEGFGRWGLFVNKHPWLVLLFSLLAIAAITTQLSKIYMDTSTEIFLHEDDPIRITYNEFRYQFGREERVILMVDSSQSIFNFEFLERLKAFHEDLENEVPKIQDVLSLVNARYTHGENDQLVVEDLLEDWPETEAELAALETLVMNHPTYRDQFIGKNDNTTLVLIQTDAFTSEGQELDALAGFDDSTEVSEKELAFISGEENNEIVFAIDRVIEKHSHDDFVITATGTPHMNTILMTILMEDMGLFASLSILAIGLILAWLFRRLSMIFLPLLISALGIIVTFSIMAALGIPFTVIAQIAPSFLLAVGVGNSVHIFAVFYQSLDSGSDKQSALVHALQHSGFAIAMTAFTTAGGLLSFTTAEIKPIADFGLIAAIGVVTVFVLTLILLPALITILPLKGKADTISHHETLNQRFLAGCARLAAQRPWHILAFCAVLVGSGLFFASQLVPSHDPIKWFKADHPFRMAMERINSDYGGGMFLEVLVDTKQENGLHNPEVLKRMEAIYAEAASFNENGVYVSKSYSVIDVNKELHQALNNNNEDYYVLPESRELIAQELLLFENSGSDDLEQLVDSQFSKARITMRMPYVDATLYYIVEDDFYPAAREIMGDYAELSFTGLMAINIETTPALIRSMISSYMLAFLIITPLMMLLLGSMRTGLMSMIPNLSPIIIVLGAMYLLEIPLEAFTLLIGCIALGLAVDDTIHFMHNYQRYYRHTGNAELAVEKSLRTTGQALLFTTIVLTVAFYIYTLSTMSNLINFGLLTGTCIALAFLADVLLAPALVILVSRYKKTHDSA